ncbi:hypothetical protein [Methylobacterium sp. J-092]|uniref:hypothetical protein n=1 Tax=Methylobacterium sp. J-092 TaxID=2836667 RepID=UPI001FBB0D2D|nr:hypothetical protein [Methylobacterium sp. J-092]MCJ2010423.1 hypothetical protein [Methylobacterium sp. J-092]
MVGWFELFHYTLVGLSVVFLVGLLYAGWQKIVELILLIHSKRVAEAVNDTVTEEREVHHIHHVSYTEEPSYRPQAARTVRASPVEYHQVKQVVEQPRAISRVKRS